MALLNKLRCAVPAIVLLALNGCGTLPTPAAEQPVNTFRLAPPLAEPAAPAAQGAPSIAVARPVAAAEFATPRLAYVQRDFEVLYYASNEWVAPPAAMLERVVVDALAASGAFSAVLNDSGVRLASRRLDVELVELSHDLRKRPAQAHVRMRLRLMDAERGTLLALGELQRSLPVDAPGPYAGVRALNLALGELLPELVAFASQ